VTNPNPTHGSFILETKSDHKIPEILTTYQSGMEKSGKSLGSIVPDIEVIPNCRWRGGRGLIVVDT